MTEIAWSDTWEMGVDAMDETHREFVASVEALGRAPDDALLARVDELIDHTARHFASENEWMTALSFPAMHCHVAEHEGVLDAMRLARGYVAEGKAEVGRVLGRELANWFANHARSMDAMLAAAIKLTGFDPADPRPVANPAWLQDAGSACHAEPVSGCGGSACACHTSPPAP